MASDPQKRSDVQIELLADDEFALWDLAVLNAERHSATNAQKLLVTTCASPAVEQVILNQVSEAVKGFRDVPSPKVPDIEDFGLKKNRLARHRPGGLMVTDIAAAEWCQQQVAFSLSARLPKVRHPTAQVELT